jgi:hypothetical protein
MCDVSNQCVEAMDTIGLDRTKPVIIGSRTPPANANGWNNTNVTVSFTCADIGSVQSGIVTNNIAGQTLVSEGANQFVTNTGMCVDAAGNFADPVTVSGIHIDKTNPTISAAVTPGAAPTGWWNIATGAPTVTYTCVDGLSGVASCSAPHLFGEGVNQTHIGMALDRAGNQNTTTVTNINVDLTAPSLTVPNPIVVPADGPSGTVVTYTTASSDNLGTVTVVCVDPSGTTFPIGTTTVNCTAIDTAGNQTFDSFTITVESYRQACLFAGSLSQVSRLWGQTTPTLSCGRGEAIVLLDGADFYACLFAGSLSQVGTTEPADCGRGSVIGLAQGQDYFACLFAGSLSQVGTNPPSCGRGSMIGLAMPTPR